MIRFLFRAVLAVFVVYLVGYGAFAAMLPGPAGDERTDAIVVLTGGSGRLERGFELLERGTSRRMLISGVNRIVRPQELRRGLRGRPAPVRLLRRARQGIDRHPVERRRGRALGRAAARSARSAWSPTRCTCRARATSCASASATGSIIVPDAVPSEPDFKDIFFEYNNYVLGRAADLIGI